MRTRQNILRFFSFGVLLCLLVQPAQARVGNLDITDDGFEAFELQPDYFKPLLPPLIFVSGIGLSFGSIYLNKSAQDSYDAYLRTASQKEIKQYKQDYLKLQTSSQVMARAGLGLAGLALVISIWKQVTDSVVTYESNLSKSAVSLGLLPQVDLAQREANIVWRRRF